MNGDTPTKKVENMKNNGFSEEDIVNSLRNESYSPQQISDAMTQANIRDQIGSPIPQQFPEPPESTEEILPPGMEDYQQSRIPTLRRQTPSQSRIKPNMNQMPEPPAPPHPESAYSEEEPIVFSPHPEQRKNMFGPVPEPSESRGITEKIEELAESIVQEKWDDLLSSMGDIHLWKENVKTDILSIKQEIVRTQQRFENLQKAILGKVEKYDQDVRNIGSEMRALEKVLEKIIQPLTTNVKELSKITEQLKKKK